MKTNWQKLRVYMPALLIGTVCILTGCAGPHGGHRGGIATGLIGTARNLTPESNIPGTTFVLNGSESKVGTPLSARFVLDTRDNGGQPVNLRAYTPGGQQQEMTLSWTTSGWKALTFVGVNGLTTAIVGVGSIPGWIGDGRNRLSSDLENNKPRFVFDPQNETPATGTPAPTSPPAANPPPKPSHKKVPARVIADNDDQDIAAPIADSARGAQQNIGTIQFGASTIVSGVATVSAPPIVTPAAPAPAAPVVTAQPAPPVEKTIHMGFVGDK